MLSDTLRETHISCIGFIMNVIFERKLFDEAFLHAIVLLLIRCQMVYQFIFVKKQMYLTEISYRVC